jgi:hypothetical protein
MNRLEKLIRELLEKGFIFNGVSLLETGELAYELTGFYKSSGIKLYEDSTYIYALARYGEITILNDGENPFDALVYLNYEWWNKSKNKFEGWVNPEEKWLPFLIEKEFFNQK